MFGSAKLPDPREKVGAIYGATRPRVERVINDPEVQEAVRRAYATGRHAFGELSKQKDIRKAAQKVAKDKRVQNDLLEVMRSLQFAVGEVAKPQRRRGRGRLMMLLAGAGAIAAFVVPSSRSWIMSKFGGGGEDGWGGSDNGGSSTGGDAVRPAGAPIRT